MPAERTQSLPGAALPGELLREGAVIDGVYRVQHLLGEGGGGAVYLVTHEALQGARFALKVLREAPGRSAEMLVREGRLAAQVSSAHVVKVAALGRLPGGAPYLVMEYVDGVTLEALLAERELSAAEAVECGAQLCLALQAAHQQGLVHGDVSTRNLFVTRKPDGTLHLQLGDFGLARRIQSTPGGTLSVELGAGRGTPRFMAPETISGQDHVDERSDLFSAGVVLYRLLSSTWPFDGSSTHEILAATLRCEPTPLGRRRPGLEPYEEIVMRCLAAKPADRFSSARELREALQAARGHGPFARMLRRARPGVIGAALATLALIAALGLQRWRERAAIPLGAALDCPDTSWGLPEPDPELAHAVAQVACARIGTTLDLDWGGGPQATTLATRLERDPRGGLRLTLEAGGRREVVQGATPYAVADEGARRIVARAAMPPMSPEEIRRWGAVDAETAAGVRRVWRRRTMAITDDPEQESRAVLARDPAAPLMHLVLWMMERDPGRRREARMQTLAHLDRLSAERAGAVRAFLAAHEGTGVEVALEDLRRAYSASPGDLDIATLYTGALANAGQKETALAVVEQVHARWPRRAILAMHYGHGTPEQEPGDHARLIGWMIEALPEVRAWTDNIALLTGSGRLAEAEAAADFAHRLGYPEERMLIAESLLALAVGDPARVERTSVRLQGSTQSWPQIVGTRMRLAAFGLRGQVAAAATLLEAQIAARRAAGDDAGALQHAADLLRLARIAGAPTLPPAGLKWVEESLQRVPLPITSFAFVSTEAAVASGARGAAGKLSALDAELQRRAGANALSLASARLRTLALVRLAEGDAAAGARWAAAGAAPLDDRVRGGFDAALALSAMGDAAGAERAYRLAASPFSIERHALESVAARLRLAKLLEHARPAEAQALRADADRIWAGADTGLRERVQGPL